MLTNRKIRKEIKKEFEQPPPFDEFCKAAGIELPPEQKKSKKRRWWIPVVSGAAACAIIVCGCIPLMLPKNTKDGNVEHLAFADDDVVYKLCEISEIKTNKDIILFDMTAMQQFNYAYSIYPNNDGNLCLGYRVNKVVFEKQIDDDLYSYLFDYMVRTYKQFEFVDFKYYKDLTERYDNHGLVYKYRISDETAYISFSIEENDYFISLKGTDGITEINQESVETFIEIAF